MPRTIDAPPTPVHWATKYKAEISIGFVLVALVSVFLGFYSLFTKFTKPAITAAPSQEVQQIQPTPIPQPKTRHNSPQQQPARTSISQVQAPPATVSQRIIEQPQVKEIAFSSSSRASITSTGPDTTFDRTQAIMGISVVKMRTFNGMTAVSFKIDGSANPRSDLNLSCGQSNYGSTVNIVDNSGKRYRYLGSTLTFPERLVCQNGLPYTLAPHEIVYETFLFDQLQENTSSFDVNFTSGNQELYSIHVVM